MCRKILILFSLLWVLASCDKAGSGEPVDIPSARIECDSAKCSAVTGPRDVYVVLSISGCAPDQIIDATTAATGTASVVCGVSGCSGNVTSWTDADNNPIATIESRTYDVCGWIDLDNDAFKDTATDAFSENSQSVTGTTLTLSDWSVTYSSRRKVRPHR